MTHILRFVGIVLCVQLYLPPAAAQDQHDLYYYLTPKSEETYNAHPGFCRVATMTGVSDS